MTEICFFVCLFVYQCLISWERFKFLNQFLSLQKKLFCAGASTVFCYTNIGQKNILRVTVNIFIILDFQVNAIPI